MKNQKKRQRSKSVPGIPRRRRVSITLTIATLVVIGGAITILSRQAGTGKVLSANETKTVSADSGKKYVTVKVAGREVQVDPQTGTIKPLTPEEARQLANGLKTMLNKSTDGLEQVQHADGSVSMDLKGRFQNVAVARTNEDGKLEQSCIDEPQQAARFFGIDPQLLGVESAKSAPSQPVVRTPARKVSQ